MGLATLFGRTRAVAQPRDTREWAGDRSRPWLEFLKAVRHPVSAACRAVIVVAVVQLATAGLSAHAELDDPYEDAAPAFKPERIATFTGPGDFQHELPPSAELTLDILAGKAPRTKKKPGIDLPVAAVTDAQDRLLVADGGSKAIVVFDFARHKYSEIELSKNGVRSIGGLAVDDKGDIYVTDPRQGKVFHLNGKGGLVGYLQPSKDVEAYYANPTGIAIDHERGFIYVCDWGRHMVVKLDRSGQVLKVLGVRGGGSDRGEFKRPSQVAVVDGNVFVLDAGNKRIQKFDADGKYLTEIRAPEGAGLAVDRWQRVLLSQPSLHRIAVLGQDGRLLGTFKNTGGGSFDPFNLWLKSEHCLYVTDRANRSVDLFRVGGAADDSCYE